MSIDRQRIKTNHSEFLSAIEKVKALLPENDAVPHDSVLELIKLFADMWFSLDAYDKDKLKSTGSIKRKAKLTGEKLANAFTVLKQTLIAKGEATYIYGGFGVCVIEMRLPA